MNFLGGDQDKEIEEVEVFDNLEDVLDYEDEEKVQSASVQLREIVSRKLHERGII